MSEDTLTKINRIVNHFEKCDLDQRNKLTEIIRKFTNLQFIIIGSHLFIDISSIKESEIHSIYLYIHRRL
jgi:hypothetical protein